MTNEELFDDMKQLLKGELSQLEQRLGDRIDAVDVKIDSVEQRLNVKIDTVEKRLIERMDDGFGGASDTAGNLIDQVDNHETRISALESA